MASLQFQELQTSRLRLRRITPEDAPVFFSRLGGRADVTEHMLWKPHTDVAESVASIRKAMRRYETGESCRWAIAESSSDSLIGIIDLIPVAGRETKFTFAYMLGREFWGHGYGTEALKAVLDFAFRECGALEVCADHFAENPSSGAVMRKAGMEYVDTIAQKYEKNGNFHDAPQYRITREDWLRQSC